MPTRPVPRNIDKPNRNAEFAFAFIGAYYGTMFLSGNEALLSMFMACATLYAVNKLTIDKPEGQAFRLFYKYMRVGKMVPSATHVKRFEI